MKNLAMLYSNSTHVFQSLKASLIVYFLTHIFVNAQVFHMLIKLEDTEL